MTIERESNHESFLINSSFWLITNGQSMPEGTAVPGGLTQAEIVQAIRQGATIRTLRAPIEPYGFLSLDTCKLDVGDPSHRVRSDFRSAENSEILSPQLICP